MPKEFMNPDGLSTPAAYTHTVSVTGGKLVFIAGQIALDENGELVGAGDFRAQATQVLKNIVTAVNSVGGTITDIVKVNIYVVNYNPSEHRPLLREVSGEIFQGHRPASTLLGVQALAVEGLLLEVEAIAVID